ncbi:uncharacterized protein L201_005385 [Kwoniella dendrophila CBS 6074]|uniref:NAD-dependent epimerase/dehydratase domain-containing protein n=1 Tax=Kwoniella dendrophila CBS 6074 TaxID=1295534 RepID=A0AAX4K0T1_9TREE
MKVFMTGASGWVGRHVLPEFIQGGYEITALARSDEAAPRIEAQGGNVVRGTLEDNDILYNSAKEADAVVHLAYIHDFSIYGGKSAQIDFAAIRSMCSALEGTNKVFVGTSGITGLNGDQLESDKASKGPRQEAENVASEYTSKGVKTIMIRLSPNVHGDGDHGLISFFIKIAKSKGYAAYVGKGENHWSGVHVKDAARLYRIAIEKSKNNELPSGENIILHSAEKNRNGVEFKEIQNVIAKKLNIPLKSLTDEQEIKDYFGTLTYFASLEVNPSIEYTKKITGWEPKEIGFLEDLETGHYFDQFKN